MTDTVYYPYLGSGKIYARVDHGGSHLMWGDFKPTEDLKGIVRSDRALYGIHGTWQSDGVTGQGEPANSPKETPGL